MLSWDEAESDGQEEDFLATANEAGERPEAAACPLNPDGLEGCEACQ